ncbi:hypothetical protein A2U01_0079458, partial [Trifolium medium]|nr:hypothetical protein [Trifolium medium]
MPQAEVYRCWLFIPSLFCSAIVDPFFQQGCDFTLLPE